MHYIKFKWNPFLAVQLLLAMVLAILLAPFIAVRDALRYGLVLALTGRDLHIDAPLSNIAVEAFDGGQFIAQEIFPAVPVGKQSNVYYVVDKKTWLRQASSTLRAPKSPPRRIEWKVSSDTYFAKNYVLGGEISDEDRANADYQVMLEDRTTRFTTEALQRDLEARVANRITSITNIGSGVVLSGGSKWSQYASSSPLSDVTTGLAFIRQRTGLRANVAVIDWDTMQILRRHPELLDYFKYTSGGMINMAQLQEAFQVSRILVADSIQNTAPEAVTQALSLSNIWGNVCMLAYINPAKTGLRTQTFGLGFRWTDPQLGVPMAVRRYRDGDEGKKLDVLEVGYYQDEKILDVDLCYGITTTL